MRSHLKLSRLVSALLLLSMAFTLSACSRKQEVSKDVLSLKAPLPGRTQISVLVKYAFSINGFEKAVEEKFPNIDLVQVGNYTKNMGTAEYESRLKNDDLTDIVMTWPLDVGEEYWEDRLLDLSGMSFTSNYNISMLNKISTNGKLYYLPGPAQVRGIVYNKTMFESNGWELPQSYEDFIQLCQTIEKTGIRSIQLGFKNREVLDTAFIGYGYADCMSKPGDSKWIAGYENGVGSFADHFMPALDTFQEMIDAGIWKPEDLEINYSDREHMLFSRQCAMAEDSVLMARMGNDISGIKDEFALMPFWNPGSEGDWARLYMVCYIGLNKKLVQPENGEKYKLVLSLMEYISSPEGQEALAADTGAMYSSVLNTTPPNIAEIQALFRALSTGRYAIFPELKNATSALRAGLAGMVRGDLTKNDVVAMVDEQNSNPPLEEQPVVLGSASETFTLAQTGGYVSDVLREYAGTDFSLFLDDGKDGDYSGKGISGRLYEGEITENDVLRILPDMKSGDKGELWKITMTGADLRTTMEHAIPVGTATGGLFYYFSGLRAQFRPTAQPGSRIQKLTTEDSKEIDPKKIYSIAIMSDTVPAEFVISCEKLGVTITDILSQAIDNEKIIMPSHDGRLVIVTP